MEPKKGVVEAVSHPANPVLDAHVVSLPSAALLTPAAGKLATAKQVRRWLAINASGEAFSLELSKHHVTHQLGVQLRDLR